MRPSGSNSPPEEVITGRMIPPRSYCLPAEVITGG